MKKEIEKIKRLEWKLTEKHYPLFSRITLGGDEQLKENGFWATGYNVALQDVLEILK